MRRRALLTAVLVALVAASGCSALGLGDGTTAAGGEGDTREVIAINNREHNVTLSVRVTNDTNATIYSGNYTLRPGYADQSGALDREPRGGEIRVWMTGTLERTVDWIPRSDPANPHHDLPPDTCEGMDLVVSAEPGGANVTYACP